MLALGTSVAATVDDESTTTTDTDTDTATAVTEFPDDFALPPGYTMLIDSTGQLTVAVPDSWTDIDLRPDSADGALVPRINAATSLDLWRETFDAPGVLYAAFPYTDDEEALYRDQVDWQDACTSEEIVPYDDGAFVGEWRQLTDCGSAGQAELHVVVASPASEDVTVIVVVQLVGPQDQAVLEVILQSFNFTPTATWPATSTTDLATTTSSDDDDHDDPCGLDVIGASGDVLRREQHRGARHQRAGRLVLRHGRGRQQRRVVPADDRRRAEPRGVRPRV